MSVSLCVYVHVLMLMHGIHSLAHFLTEIKDARQNFFSQVFLIRVLSLSRWYLIIVVWGHIIIPCDLIYRIDILKF